jgi:hypothetical protein
VGLRFRRRPNFSKKENTNMGISTSTATATIATGTALSAGLVLGAKVLSAVQMPAAWDAADITFQTSDDNGATWVDLLDDAGNEIKITAPAAGKRLQLDPSNFLSAVFLKVRSGTSALPVNQNATRALGLVARQYYALR